MKRLILLAILPLLAVNSYAVEKTVSIGKMKFGSDAEGFIRKQETEALSVEFSILKEQITVGVLYHDEGIHNSLPYPDNTAAYVLFNTKLGQRFKFGIGGVVFDKDTVAFDVVQFENDNGVLVTDNPFGFALKFSVDVGKNKRTVLGLTHFSTGGLTENNRGMNFFNIGRKF